MKKLRNIDASTIVVGIAIVVLVISLVVFFNLNFNTATKSVGISGNYGNLPEKCRPPAGQDIESWKQHLGHHAETQDCLQYFK